MCIAVGWRGDVAAVAAALGVSPVPDRTVLLGIGIHWQGSVGLAAAVAPEMLAADRTQFLER